MTAPQQTAFVLHHDLTLRQAFEQFHLLNPHVYRALVQKARALVRAGHTQFGIAVLWESLRYDTMLVTKSFEADYKLNNSFRSLYARRIMEQEPDLRGVFFTRTLKNESVRDLED